MEIKKPKRWGQYRCPNGKLEDGVPSIRSHHLGSDSTVSGRFCKNNCSDYKNNNCSIFKG